jgi:hypothetical protein
MSALTGIWAYLSPETVLPLTSIVATIAGGAMLLTRGSLKFILRCFRNAVRRPRRVARAGAPHFHTQGARVTEKPRG